MPFSRPTLTELIDRVSTDIASRLPGQSANLLRRSLAGVLARAEAGAVHSLYGYLDFIAKQAIPDTAEDEYLLRWAAIWLEVGRKPATFASGAGAVRVSGVTGSVVPVDTQFVRADGLTFHTTTEATLSGTFTTVSVKADTVGAESNTGAGVALTLLQPVTGLNSAALVVAPGIAGGVDQETLPALRVRLIQRIQQPPQGGSAADYVTWALEVPGVTRAWVSPRELGPGTVTVRIGNDDAAASYIPSPALVAAAQAYISSKAPVTADVTVLAPVAYPIDLSIGLKPNSAANQAAVRAELTDMFLREAAPGATILISKIREAASITAGVINSEVTVPSGDVTAPTGYLPTVGTITWSSLP